MKMLMMVILLINLLYSTEGTKPNGWFYNSAFGFTSSNIPENWTVITKENSHSILNPLLKQNNLAKDIDSRTLNKVRNLIDSGNYEVLIYKNNSGMLLVQQISNKKLSLDLKEVVFCGGITNVLQKQYNRKNNTTVNYCKQKSIFGINTLSYKHDSITIGFKTIGYSFNTSNKMISFSLTCKNNLCEEVQQDTEKIFKTLKFKNNKKATTEEVDKVIKYLNNLLPNEFCKADGYFINCFNTSKSNCLNVSKKSVETCSKANKKILYDTDRLKHAGEIIGRCAGPKAIINLGNYKNTNICNNWFK